MEKTESAFRTNYNRKKKKIEYKTGSITNLNVAFKILLASILFTSLRMWVGVCCYHAIIQEIRSSWTTCKTIWWMGVLRRLCAHSCSCLVLCGLFISIETQQVKVLVNLSCDLWRVSLFVWPVNSVSSTPSVKKTHFTQTVDIVLAFKGVIQWLRFYTDIFYLFIYFILHLLKIKWLGLSTENRTRAWSLLGKTFSDLTLSPTGSFLIVVWTSLEHISCQC